MTSILFFGIDEGWSKNVDLDIVSESLVELGNLVGDGKVDSTITDLNNETSQNIGVNSVGNLKSLSLTNKRRLGDRGLKTVNSLVVKGGSGGDSGLNNTLGSIGQGLELLSNRRNESKSVVLGEEVKEVNDSLVGIDSRGESLNDSLLVVSRQSRVFKDAGDLRVVLDKILQGSNGSLSASQRGRLDSSSVLETKKSENISMVGIYMQKLAN